MTRSHTAWIFVLPLLLVLWGVAVWGTNADAIWVDEWWTTYYIGAAPNAELTSPLAVIERVAANRVHENNPVGYYVLLHLWGGMVGTSDVALRLFSALCSVLTVAVIYRLGRAMGGARVALTAALILAFSAFFVNYSHELRMYALAALWAALGLLAYWKFMMLRRVSWLWGALLLLSAAGLLYTHYGNTMLVVLLGLVHLAARTKNRRWWQALGIAISAGLLFVPHLPITLGIGNRFTEKLTTSDTIQGGIWPVPDVIRMTVMGFANENILFVLILLIAAGVTLWRVFAAREANTQHSAALRLRAALLMSGALSVGGILTLVALRLSFQTVFHVRYLLVVWLPLSLFAALVITHALARLPLMLRSLAAAGLALAWIAVGLALSLDMSAHSAYIHPLFRAAFTEVDRWDDLGDDLRREATSQDAVAVSVGDDLAWAHRGDAEYYVARSAARLLMLEGEGVNPTDFSDFVHGASRVWLARSLTRPASPQYEQMEAALKAKGYQPCGEAQTRGHILLTLYSVVPDCCTPPPAVLGAFGERAVLRAHRVIMHEGERHIWQGWQVNADTPPDTYSIGWYVFDAAGTVISQTDRTLLMPGYACLLIEMPPSPNDAALRVGVYDWRSGGRLALSAAAGQSDNLLPLPLD